MELGEEGVEFRGGGGIVDEVAVSESGIEGTGEAGGDHEAGVVLLDESGGVLGGEYGANAGEEDMDILRFWE